MKIVSESTSRMNEKCEMFTVQKMKFSIKDFFSKCDQIHKKLRIWSHLLKKSLIENFIFCAMVINKKITHLMPMFKSQWKRKKTGFFKWSTSVKWFNTS